MGAIRREMNNAKWFWGAIGYQCGLAYMCRFVFINLGGCFKMGTFFTGLVLLGIVCAIVFSIRKDMKKNKCAGCSCCCAKRIM